MKSLFIFIILGFELSVHANSQILFNPGRVFVPGRQIIASGDYEDIKIDSNRDGKIDFWSVKSGNSTIAVYFKNDRPEKIFTRSVGSTGTLEYTYKINRKGLLVRSQTRKRKNISMYLVKSSSNCQAKLKSLQDQLIPLKKTIEDDLLFKAIESDLVDKSCQNKLDEEGYNSLTRAVFNNLSPERDFIGKCISNEKIFSFFDQTEESKLGVEILRASYELQRYQLIQNSSTFKPTFKCDLSKNICGVTGENLAISLPASSTSNSCDYNEVIPHELLHRSGLMKEEEITNLVKVCENIDNPSFSFSKDRKGKLPPPLVGNAAAAEVASISESTANIKGESVIRDTPTEIPSNSPISIASQDLSAAIPAEMTVEQSGIPSVAALSTGLNAPYPKTDEGPEVALKASKALSGPLIARANNLLGAMNSIALATPTLASNSQPVNTNGLAKGERIVQQITLDGDDNSKPKNAVNTQTLPSQNSKLDSLTEKGLPSQSQANLNTNADALVPNAPGGSRSPASIGGKESSWNTSPPTGGRAPTNTRRSAASSPSPEEVITFISRVDYAIAKEKLKDSSFTQQLASQGITILDLNGNTYGAKKGTVIFLDEGNRFVRQK